MAGIHTICIIPTGGMTEALKAPGIDSFGTYTQKYSNVEIPDEQIINQVT